MQSPAWYFHRLRSMGPAEIAWRVRSVISANLDLLRIPRGWLPTLKESQIPQQNDRGFACMPAEALLDWSGDGPAGEWRARLLRKADSILENRLSYFDLVEQPLGDPVDWHRDHSAAISSTRGLSGLIDYRDFDVEGDCKLVWEPNRHHQLVVLARAWQVTGDTKYANKVVSLLREWLDSNPFGYGMNWKSPLEVGIRLINWVWAIDLIRDANAFDDSTWRDVMQSVYLAMWDTQRKFSKGSSANNHVIGEAAGVFVAALYFSAMPNADKWANKARVVLEREILAQTFASGCTREHAFGYQFFVIQFQTVCELAGQRARKPLSAAFRDRLQAMYQFMADICADTGRPPNFGDADDGYVLDLGERPDDAVQQLAVGALMFDDERIGFSPQSETAWWLYGDQSLQVIASDNARSSKAYKDAGYFLLRNDGARQEDSMAVFFDCAELGFGSIAAHGHADCLSFSLTAGGCDILVDPGTYDYFSYPAWRQYFRSTQAHNTARVDGMDQSESLGPFLWGRRANATLLDWQTDAERCLIRGEHDGYTRLSDPVIHRRSVTLAKAERRVDIIDSFDAKDGHDVELSFHVAPQCTVQSRSDNAVDIAHGDMRFRLTADSGKLRVVAAEDGDFPGWISNGYHRREPGHCIVVETRIEGCASVATTIEWLLTP